MNRNKQKFQLIYSSLMGRIPASRSSDICKAQVKCSCFLYIPHTGKSLRKVDKQKQLVLQ